MAPSLTLHILPPSHPCMAVKKALDLKGLEYETVTLSPGPHVEEMAKLYGDGNTTVPGLLIEDEPVHGSRPIFARLEELEAEPALFPDPIAEQVREADRWGDDELQDLGRRFAWGALHFRPEAMGTLAGGDPLDPSGTDFAIKFVRASWKYHGISCELLASDLAAFPAKVAHIEQLAADGVIGGEVPNAADLQIGSTIRVLLTVGDLEPLLGGTAAERIALALFPDYPGHVPAGAFPAGWVPNPA
jgi:glutathione S-transferase